MARLLSDIRILDLAPVRPAGTFATQLLGCMRRSDPGRNAQFGSRREMQLAFSGARGDGNHRQTPEDMSICALKLKDQGVISGRPLIIFRA